MYCWSTWRSTGNSVARLRYPPAPEKKETKDATKEGATPPQTHDPDCSTSAEVRSPRERLMKKIEAIFKPFKLDEIKEALAKENTALLPA